jgi:hypothetical protein
MLMSIENLGIMVVILCAALPIGIASHVRSLIKGDLRMAVLTVMLAVASILCIFMAKDTMRDQAKRDREEQMFISSSLHRGWFSDITEIRTDMATYYVSGSANFLKGKIVSKRIKMAWPFSDEQLLCQKGQCYKIQ